MTVTELASWEGGSQYDCHRASLLGGREPSRNGGRRDEYIYVQVE